MAEGLIKKLMKGFGFINTEEKDLFCHHGFPRGPFRALMTARQADAVRIGPVRELAWQPRSTLQRVGGDYMAMSVQGPPITEGLDGPKGSRRSPKAIEEAADQDLKVIKKIAAKAQKPTKRARAAKIT